MADNARDGPRLIVVCGVSGSGKSTLARELARRCALRYLEGDDFHSAAAKARMAQGQPLDDAWRAPWIESIASHLRTLATSGNDCVLAFSGLRRRYREPLRRTGFHTCFLLLTAPRELIHGRLQHRSGHFMPASLLDSQFRALEAPAREEDVLELDVARPVEQVVEHALALLSARGFCPPHAPPAS